MSSENSKSPVSSVGELIRAQMNLRGWTQDDLGRVLDRPQSRINELIKGKLTVSPEWAISLAAAFDTAPEFWMHADAAYQLSKAGEQTEPIRRRSKLFQLAPIKEMQKRGWIHQTDDMTILETDLCTLFAVSRVDEEPSIFGAMRKTYPNLSITPAQRAWACRIRQVAAMIPMSALSSYDEDRLEACQHELRKVAALSTGAKQAPAILLKYGIRFVVVEPLAGGKVDGFASWLDASSPVIGMSLRYDRLDYFWFTLAHELSHIKNRDAERIDGDAIGADEISLEVKSPVELRADQEAASLFISQKELDSFIARAGPFYSKDRINQFANRIKMHPQIIVGQLKHRGEIGYSAQNTDLIKVRTDIVGVALTDGWGKTIGNGGTL